MPNDPTSRPVRKEPAPLAAKGGGTPAEGDSSTKDTALCDLKSHLRLWSVVVLGLVADLWSKEWAFRALGQDGRQVLVPNVLEFRTTLNPGALFGMGEGRTGVFIVASILALALVVWMFAQCPRRRWLMHIALGAILAGALGNMYDRIFVQLVRERTPVPGGTVVRWYIEDQGPDGTVILHEYPGGSGNATLTIPKEVAQRLPRPVGCVRDFIKIPTRWFGGHDIWPWVFNTADMLLVGGVAILALRMLQDRKAHRRAGLDASPENP